MRDLQSFNHGFHGWHGWKYLYPGRQPSALGLVDGKKEFSAKNAQGQAEVVSVADDVEAFDSLEVLRISGQETCAVTFGRGRDPKVVVRPVVEFALAAQGRGDASVMLCSVEVGRNDIAPAQQGQRFLHTCRRDHGGAVEELARRRHGNDKCFGPVGEEGTVDRGGQITFGPELVDQDGGIDANHGFSMSHLADLRLDVTTDSNLPASVLLPSPFPQTAAASRTASAQVP